MDRDREETESPRAKSRSREAERTIHHGWEQDDVVRCRAASPAPAVWLRLHRSGQVIPPAGGRPVVQIPPANPLCVLMPCLCALCDELPMPRGAETSTAESTRSRSRPRRAKASTKTPRRPPARSSGTKPANTSSTASVTRTATGARSSKKNWYRMA